MSETEKKDLLIEYGGKIIISAIKIIKIPLIIVSIVYFLPSDIDYEKYIDKFLNKKNVEFKFGDFLEYKASSEDSAKKVNLLIDEVKKNPNVDQDEMLKQLELLQKELIDNNLELEKLFSSMDNEKTVYGNLNENQGVLKLNNIGHIYDVFGVILSQTSSISEINDELTGRNFILKYDLPLYDGTKCYQNPKDGILGIVNRNQKIKIMSIKSADIGFDVDFLLVND